MATIRPGCDALTARVLVDRGRPTASLGPVRRRLRGIAGGFGIGRITLQVEQSLDDCTEHHHVDHLPPAGGA